MVDSLGVVVDEYSQERYTKNPPRAQASKLAILAQSTLWPWAGEWVAIIKGERLDKMHEELREGRRISIRVCRSPKERDGAVVESIQIRELEG